MSGSGKGSERSPLLSHEQSSSDTNSCHSFSDVLDVDPPDTEAPLLGDVPLPSSPTRHGVTAFSGTLIVVSLGVLVFLQGIMGFPTCESQLIGNVNACLVTWFYLSVILFVLPSLLI